MTREYKENFEGVHLMSIVGSGEETLCGIHFQTGEKSNLSKEIYDYDDKYLLVRTNKKIVTCERCIREILNCKNVKIKNH